MGCGDRREVEVDAVAPLAESVGLVKAWEGGEHRRWELALLDQLSFLQVLLEVLFYFVLNIVDHALHAGVKVLVEGTKYLFQVGSG